jgi:hypothetical protein
MTARLLIAPVDGELHVESSDGGSTTLVLSSRAIGRRSLSTTGADNTVWVARRGDEQSVWNVDSADGTGTSSSTSSYLSVQSPSTSWIDQYGAAAHYAFYAHVLANPAYASVSLYA